MPKSQLRFAQPVDTLFGTKEGVGDLGVKNVEFSRHDCVGYAQEAQAKAGIVENSPPRRGPYVTFS